jgi:predicted ester cyclase/limonene-1,2-epoxide hydrolase
MSVVDSSPQRSNQRLSNVQTARSLMRALEACDASVWRRLAAPHFIHHFEVPGLDPGVDGVVAMAERLIASVVDLHVDVEASIADEVHVVLRNAIVARTRNGVPLAWTETHCLRFDEAGVLVELRPALRLTRLLARLEGRPEPEHRPAGTWWSPIPAAFIRAASRVVSKPSRSNLEVIQMYVEEFKNQQRFTVFPRLFAADFAHHFGYVNDPGGMTSWVRTGQDFLTGFPDVKVKLHALIAEGDYVAEVNTATGTHRGSFRGIEATGRVVSWNETDVYRLREGRIVENWPEVDVDGLCAQLVAGAP